MGKKYWKRLEERGLIKRNKGEAGDVPVSGDELPVSRNYPESLSRTDLIEEVLESENLRKAYKRVVANKGAPGVDGMKVEELRDYLKTHIGKLKEDLKLHRYVPSPVRRVDIPKPGGGSRKLGIPTVLDRFIQQALLQVLQGHWDATFSDHSYGFRPNRSAHDAVKEARSYVEQGYKMVVDIDLEKFFDKVHHDRLMSEVMKRVKDKRILKLIRRYLQAGVLEHGLVSPSTEGTPQGGPLSPFLSNIMLDLLDKELERRGSKFVRYADDCNIYVKSQRAGERVKAGVTHFIEKRLKLKVNEKKSEVARTACRSFLGFYHQDSEGSSEDMPIKGVGETPEDTHKRVDQDEQRDIRF